MKRYFALLLASLLLASCAVYTPAGSVVVDPNGPGPRHDGGGFCPPGQAKKGNCLLLPRAPSGMTPGV